MISGECQFRSSDKAGLNVISTGVDLLTLLQTDGMPPKNILGAATTLT